jgi:hypothetical protein
MPALAFPLEASRPCCASAPNSWTGSIMRKSYLSICVRPLILRPSTSRLTVPKSARCCRRSPARSRVWQLVAHRPTTNQGVRVVNDWQVCCRSPADSVHARSARNSAANSVWSREAVQETGRLSVGSCAVATQGRTARPTGTNGGRTPALSKKEILRCLKRYIARQLYRLLVGPIAVPTGASHVA